MKLIDKIKAWAVKQKKAQLFDGKYKIVPAFKCGGIQYYMFEDPMNILTGRGLSGLVAYEEMTMRCDVSYLKTHTEAMEKILNSPKISLTEITKLNIYLKERVQMLDIIPDQIWKIASVYFFDENESPFMYDQKHAQTKIEHWKKHQDIIDFFYQTPLSTLLPHLKLADENSSMRLEVAQKVSEYHKSHLLTLISRSS